MNTKKDWRIQISPRLIAQRMLRHDTALTPFWPKLWNQNGTKENVGFVGNWNQRKPLSLLRQTQSCKDNGNTLYISNCTLSLIKQSNLVSLITRTYKIRKKLGRRFGVFSLIISFSELYIHYIAIRD